MNCSSSWWIKTELECFSFNCNVPEEFIYVTAARFVQCLKDKLNSFTVTEREAPTKSGKNSIFKKTRSSGKN
jgi:hypothetical protein